MCDVGPPAEVASHYFKCSSLPPSLCCTQTEISVSPHVVAGRSVGVGSPNWRAAVSADPAVRCHRGLLRLRGSSSSVLPRRPHQGGARCRFPRPDLHLYLRHGDLRRTIAPMEAATCSISCQACHLAHAFRIYKAFLVALRDMSCRPPAPGGQTTACMCLTFLGLKLSAPSNVCVSVHTEYIIHYQLSAHVLVVWYWA